MKRSSCSPAGMRRRAPGAQPERGRAAASNVGGEAAVALARDELLAAEATLSVGGNSPQGPQALGVPVEMSEEMLPLLDDELEKTHLIVPPDSTDWGKRDWPLKAVTTFDQLVRRCPCPVLGVFTSPDSYALAADERAGNSYALITVDPEARVLLVQAPHSPDSRGRTAQAKHSHGESPRCLFLDRLPFPLAEDPVLAAQKEQDARWFEHYSLPRAVLVFRRCLARLVMSSPGPRAFVVHDPRLFERAYGSVFLKGLEAMPRSRDLSSIAQYLIEEK